MKLFWLRFFFPNPLNSRLNSKKRDVCVWFQVGKTDEEERKWKGWLLPIPVIVYDFFLNKKTGMYVVLSSRVAVSNYGPYTPTFHPPAPPPPFPKLANQMKILKKNRKIWPPIFPYGLRWGTTEREPYSVIPQMVLTISLVCYAVLCGAFDIGEVNSNTYGNPLSREHYQSLYDTWTERWALAVDKGP